MSEGRFNLSALAVRERAVTLFLICLITLAGVVSFFKLGRAEDPAFTVKVMTVVTAWPGATPDRRPTLSSMLRMKALPESPTTRAVM